VVAVMDKAWIGLMVSRTLPHDDGTAISKELKLIFRQDLIGYKVVCNESMSSSGEYFLFVNCNNYWEHTEALNRCHYITGVIPSRESPHHFSNKEILEFMNSAGYKEENPVSLGNGDVVLVKDGYLKGLYGIITKNLPRKKAKVFFSFYVRQFFEVLSVTSLEFIGKVSGCEFPSGNVDKPIVIGAHVVHHRKLHREQDRKHKAG
jgi:hypothetical protein